MFISLKPLAERKITADQIIARLRPKLARCRAPRSICRRAGPAHRRTLQSRAQYQFTMQGDNLQDLITYSRPACWQELKHHSIITDVNSDQQDRGCKPW
jgi:multidrug efflux pump